jgi:hypothetical protein
MKEPIEFGGMRWRERRAKDGSSLVFVSRNRVILEVPFYWDG